MIYHILTGDALLSNFPDGKLEGTIIINRECLIEGPLAADSLAEFWNHREEYLLNSYSESEINYSDEVVFEFEKLNDIKESDEVNLWFEYDLFCQTNLWFTLNLIQTKSISIYRVCPLVKNPDYLWDGFGPMSPNELLACYHSRILLDDSDIQLGKSLWQSYAANNLETFAQLAETGSEAYPYLKDVCKAHIQRSGLNGLPGRPEKVLKEIVDAGSTTFSKAFQEFSKREGIYGFGDAQVKKIYDQLRD